MASMTHIQKEPILSLEPSTYKSSWQVRPRISVSIGFSKAVPGKEIFSSAKINDLFNDLRIDKNIELIESFGALEEGWDSYEARRISDDVIQRAKRLIKKLNIQPEIFPTPRGTIQFEYEKDENYLEAEIFSDKFVLYYEIAGEEESKEYTDIYKTISEINKYAEEIEQERQYTTI